MKTTKSKTIMRRGISFGLAAALLAGGGLLGATSAQADAVDIGQGGKWIAGAAGSGEVPGWAKTSPIRYYQLPLDSVQRFLANGSHDAELAIGHWLDLSEVAGGDMGGFDLHAQAYLAGGPAESAALLAFAHAAASTNPIVGPALAAGFDAARAAAAVEAAKVAIQGAAGAGQALYENLAAIVKSAVDTLDMEADFPGDRALDGGFDFEVSKPWSATSGAVFTSVIDRSFVEVLPISEDREPMTAETGLGAIGHPSQNLLLENRGYTRFRDAVVVAATDSRVGHIGGRTLEVDLTANALIAEHFDLTGETILVDTDCGVQGSQMDCPESLGLSAKLTYPGIAEVEVVDGAIKASVLPTIDPSLRHISLRQAGYALATDGSQVPFSVLFTFGSPNAGERALITELDPDRGPSKGGTEVIIIGDHFDVCSVASIDGERRETVFVSEQELRFTTPAHDAGEVDVIVESTCGSDASDPAKFTFYKTFEADTGIEPRTDLAPLLIGGAGGLLVALLALSGIELATRRRKGGAIE